MPKASGFRPVIPDTAGGQVDETTVAQRDIASVQAQFALAEFYTPLVDALFFIAYQRLAGRNFIFSLMAPARPHLLQEFVFAIRGYG